MINLSEEQHRVMERAILHFGLEYHFNKVKEECAELIVAISHFQDGKCTLEELIDEVADVFIISNQAARQIGEESVQDRVDFKVNRVDERIKEI